MPSQASDIARRAHEVFNSGDFEAFVELWDADCEYRPALEGGVQGGGGGTPVSIAVGHVWTFRGGQVTHIHAFPWAEALETVGLSPE